MTEKLESINPSEPFLYWIANDKINEMLSPYNIKILENIDSAEMEKRYLTLKDGTIAEKILQKLCLLKGELKK
jgi:hypothetical protein